MAFIRFSDRIGSAYKAERRPRVESDFTGKTTFAPRSGAADLKRPESKLPPAVDAAAGRADDADAFERDAAEDALPRGEKGNADKRVRTGSRSARE